MEDSQLVPIDDWVCVGEHGTRETNTEITACLETGARETDLGSQVVPDTRACVKRRNVETELLPLIPDTTPRHVDVNEATPDLGVEGVCAWVVGVALIVIIGYSWARQG